jgi:hypothetical protein
LVISISFIFWFTTRTGSVNSVPPPAWGVWIPARATSPTTLSVRRSTVGTCAS